MKKILFLAGTRPEIIKLAPIFLLLKKNKQNKVIFCTTGQHRELALLAASIFQIKFDYNLNVMKKNQDLFLLSANILKKLRIFFRNNFFDIIIVQGDTTSSMVGALSAFYSKTKIIHIEAGLRSNNKSNPFPEELNRSLISCMADIHCAPTNLSKLNLIKEGIDKRKIFLTGNTVIDSLSLIINKFNLKKKNSKLILCTIHRKENQGNNLKLFCKKLKVIAKSFKDWKFLFIFHPNPNIRVIVNNELKNIINIKLQHSLNYLDFLRYLCKSSIVISDSGGLQEECAFLGKFIIIIRDNTERPEIITARLGRLNPIKNRKFIDIIRNLIEQKVWNKCSPSFCFGRGNSSKKISKIINKII